MFVIGKMCNYCNRTYVKELVYCPLCGRSDFTLVRWQGESQTNEPDAPEWNSSPSEWVTDSSIPSK